MKNIDKVRKMDTRTLAKWLVEKSCPPGRALGDENCKSCAKCWHCWTWWLESEAEVKA